MTGGPVSQLPSREFSSLARSVTVACFLVLAACGSGAEPPAATEGTGGHSPSTSTASTSSAATGSTHASASASTASTATSSAGSGGGAGGAGGSGGADPSVSASSSATGGAGGTGGATASSGSGGAAIAHPASWSKSFPAIHSQTILDLGTDGAGNIYVTAWLLDGGQVDFGGGPVHGLPGGAFALAKFDPAGNHLWSRAVGAGYAYAKIAVRDDGEFVVAGSFYGPIDFGDGTHVPSGGGGDVDVFLARFDPDGGVRWSKTFDGNDFQAATGVTLDSSGNVAVVGWFMGDIDLGGGPLVSAGQDDAFVARFDPDGAHLWSRRFGAQRADGGAGVAIGLHDEIILGGTFNGTVDFGGFPLTAEAAPNGFPMMDGFVAKLSPDGDVLWVEQLGGYSSQGVKEVAVDSKGNLLVSGYFWSEILIGDSTWAADDLVSSMFIAKFSPDGDVVWSKGLLIDPATITDDNPASAILALRADGGDNIAMAGVYLGALDLGGGTMTSSAGTQDALVAKFDPSGNHLWSIGFGGQGSDYARGAAFQPSGSLVVGGRFAKSMDVGNGPLPTLGNDIFLAEFPP